MVALACDLPASLMNRISRPDNRNKRQFTQMMSALTIKPIPGVATTQQVAGSK